MTQSYIRGFIEKCAEYGINGKEALSRMQKTAGRVSLIRQGGKFLSGLASKGKDLVSGTKANQLRQGLSGLRGQSVQQMNKLRYSGGALRARPLTGAARTGVINKAHKPIRQQISAIRTAQRNTNLARAGLATTGLGGAFGLGRMSGSGAAEAGQGQGQEMAMAPNYGPHFGGGAPQLFGGVSGLGSNPSMGYGLDGYGMYSGHYPTTRFNRQNWVENYI